MPTSQYFCRILFLDSDQPISGLKMNYSNVFFTDKKQFTFGSGAEADIQIAGPDVDALHFSVIIEGSKLFVKNFNHGDTHLSSYKVPFDKVEPYTPGEAIRAGGFKQVIFVELFRKFVDPASESESIIREAWERAKEAESIVEEHKQTLHLMKIQGEEMKQEAKNEANLIIEEANERSEEIESQALKLKDELIKATLQEKEATLLRVNNDLQAKKQELQLAAEQNARKLMEEAQAKNKELKQLVEREIEALQASAKKQAELTIEVAKKKAHEISEESRIQNQALAHIKEEFEIEISQAHKDRAAAGEALKTMQLEVRDYEDVRKQVIREHEMEKERLRLVTNGLQEQINAKESEARAMQAKVEDLTVHFNQVTKKLEEAKAAGLKELQRCKAEAEAALLQKENLTTEAANLSIRIQEFTTKMHQLDAEHAAISERVSKMQAEEIHERDKMRENLKKEHEARKEFELKWHAEQRLAEQKNAERERLLQEQIERENLKKQSQDIVEKILPQLNQELTPYLNPEQAPVVLQQMEKLFGPLVERSVTEEFEFRRKYAVEIQPAKVNQIVDDYKRGQHKQYGMLAVSVVLFVMAALITWSKVAGVQIAYLTLTPQEPAGVSSPRLPSSAEGANGSGIISR